MRRIIAILGALALAACLAGCGAEAASAPDAGAGCHRSLAWAEDNIGPGETATISGPGAGARCAELARQGQLGEAVAPALDAGWPLLCDYRWPDGLRVAVRWRPSDRPPLGAGMDERQTDMVFCRTLAATAGAVAVGDARPPAWPTVVPLFASGR